MFREISNVEWAPERRRFKRLQSLVVGGNVVGTVTEEEHDHMERLQGNHPIPIPDGDGTVFWWYCGRFYRDDEGRAVDDVRAIVFNAHLRRREEIERADRIPRIAPDVLLAVWDRDGGRCHDCGSDDTLEFARFVPLAEGGSSSVDNLLVVCADCSRGRSEEAATAADERSVA